MPLLTSAAGRFCYFNSRVATGGTAYRFDVTGSDQYWTMPTGVYSVKVELYGANGGKYSTTPGGKGGYVSGTLNASPGTVLTLVVGANGGSIYALYGGGGAGASGNNGGGRSAIIISAIEVVTAGGGGGAAGGSYSGGDGGGSVGQTPLYGDGSDGTPPTGGSSDDNTGGVGGTYVYSRTNGYDGGQFYGGDHGTYGGGGGSGYYGGGGGASDLQPGAGGSSYTGELSGTIVSTQGVGGNTTNGGDGYIIITLY